MFLNYYYDNGDTFKMITNIRLSIDMPYYGEYIGE